MQLIDIDPVKWLDDLLTSLFHGRGVMLTWPRSAATGAQVEMMFRRYGIRVYHRQYTDNNDRPYGVTVRKEQEKWARYLLDTYLASGAMPKEWGVPAPPSGFGGMVVDWLSGGFQ